MGAIASAFGIGGSATSTQPKGDDGLERAHRDALSDVSDCESTVRTIETNLAGHGAKVANCQAALSTALEAQARDERALADDTGDSTKAATALASSDRAVRIAKLKHADATILHETALGELAEAKASLAAARMRAASAKHALDVEALRVASSLTTLHEKCDPLARRFLKTAFDLQSIAKELLAALAASNEALLRWGELTGTKVTVRDGGHLLLAAVEDLIDREVVDEQALSVFAGECGPNSSFMAAPGRVADLFFAFLRDAPSKAKAEAARALAARMREHPTHQSAFYADKQPDRSPVEPGTNVAHDFAAPRLPVRGGTR